MWQHGLWRSSGKCLWFTLIHHITQIVTASCVSCCVRRCSDVCAMAMQRWGQVERRKTACAVTGMTCGNSIFFHSTILSTMDCKVETFGFSSEKDVPEDIFCVPAALALLHRDQFDQHWKPKKASRLGLVVVDTRYLRLRLQKIAHARHHIYIYIYAYMYIIYVYIYM